MTIAVTSLNKYIYRNVNQRKYITGNTPVSPIPEEAKERATGMGQRYACFVKTYEMDSTSDELTKPPIHPCGCNDLWLVNNIRSITLNVTSGLVITLRSIKALMNSALWYKRACDVASH